MEIRSLLEVDSTNEEAKRLFLAGEINRPIGLVAKHQTRGKGTQGRTWVSPEGGIYLSLIHPSNDNPIPMTTLFTLSAGIACVEAIKTVTNLTVQLKPINDLMVNRKKLGGILTETLVQQGQIRALITGIGINIKPVLSQLKIQTTSLAEELPPHQYERFLTDRLIEALAYQVDDWHQKVFAQDTRAVESAWKSYQIPGSELPKIY